jgi:hypothetical protein
MFTVKTQIGVLFECHISYDQVHDGSPDLTPTTQDSLHQPQEEVEEGRLRRVEEFQVEVEEVTVQVEEEAHHLQEELVVPLEVGSASQEEVSRQLE